ncbi:MAG: N-6 DNA methylase, partial [Deltaproteobacteria bacterium]|nr:N-6 DNA methylase [Deltaproteobacteria bacterium]
ITHLRRRRQEWRNLRLYGQERNLMTSSIARMNCFLHGIEDFRIERGDTLAEPKLVQGDRLMRFDVVLANPPYSIKQWDRDAFASDPWGRNCYGTPPQGRADYAFWQHILQSLAPTTGRCAILFPHGVLFRQEEGDMRRKLIEADAIECVLGLGPNLFYNSPMEACVLICRTAKAKERRNKILFINAVNEVTRERAQSFLTDDHNERIVKAYEEFTDELGFTRVVGLEEIRARDGNLSILLYVAPNESAITVESRNGTSLSATLDGWLTSRKAVAESLRNILPDISSPTLNETLNCLETCALFDRSNWQYVRFGDVVENLNETERDPEEAGIERFIGLEHLEPGSLHIRAWGSVADGTTFTRRCQPGQVLFGKRRAYQRKVAVAEFEAVVSGDIYVLAPKNDRLLPGLLPFLCMSERFFQFAVETSAGSLSPRTNWSHLAKFEFALPPPDQQRRIAAILWAVDEVEQNTSEMLEALEQAKAATVDKSVSAARKAGQTIPLIDGCYRVTDGTHQPPKFTDEGIPFFLVKTISSGRVDWGHTKFVSQHTYGELTKRVRPKRGDILYTAVGATYGVALLVDFDDPFVFQRHIAHIIPNPTIFDSGYLSLFLNSPHGKRQSDKAAIGSAQPTVTLTSLSRFQVPCPALEQQKELVVRAGGFCELFDPIS